MATTLSADSTIEELAEMPSPNHVLSKIFYPEKNRESLAARNIQTLGDLLTPKGETALIVLNGTGKKTIRALYSFLHQNGLPPDWPYIESLQTDPASKICSNLNLAQAIEAADRQYAVKKGGPVGEFSKKIRENTKEQENGACLKGRRTL